MPSPSRRSPQKHTATSSINKSTSNEPITSTVNHARKRSRSNAGATTSGRHGVDASAGEETGEEDDPFDSAVKKRRALKSSKGNLTSSTDAPTTTSVQNPTHSDATTRAVSCPPPQLPIDVETASVPSTLGRSHFDSRPKSRSTTPVIPIQPGGLGQPFILLEEKLDSADGLVRLTPLATNEEHPAAEHWRALQHAANLGPEAPIFANRSSTPSLDASVDNVWKLLRRTFSGAPGSSIRQLAAALRLWSEESRLRAPLASHYTQERIVMEMMSAAASEGAPAMTRKSSSKLKELTEAKSLVERFVLASRAGLLPDSPPAPHASSVEQRDELAALLLRLESEASQQHAKNETAFQVIAKRVLEWESAKSEAPHASKRARGSPRKPASAPKTHANLEWLEADEEVDRAYVKELVKQTAAMLEPPQSRAPRSKGANEPIVCHHCSAPHTPETHHLGEPARCVRCPARYCRSCLRKTYDLSLGEMSNPEWVCPKCTGTCWCAPCVAVARVIVLKRAFNVAGDESSQLSLLEKNWFNE